MVKGATKHSSTCPTRRIWVQMATSTKTAEMWIREVDVMGGEVDGGMGVM